MKHARTLAAGLIFSMGASLAIAQDAPQKDEPADDKAAEKTDAPSLDELLGLPESGDAETPAEDAPDDDLTKKRLEEELNSAEAIRDEFKLALKEMDESADRLEFSLDTGPVTQRLQQSIIRRLEGLIEASQQQSSSSSSSSSSSQQQQQQPQQPQQGSGQSQSQDSQGENNGERLPPGGGEADPRETLDATRAAWGSLPERVRDALQQGSSDYFSRLYDAMTESYYKRLAEEGTER